MCLAPISRHTNTDGAPVSKTRRLVLAQYVPSAQCGECTVPTPKEGAVPDSTGAQ